MQKSTRINSIKALLSIVTLLMATSLQAQPFRLEWAKQMGGAETDENSSVAVDNEGNVYTTGYFTGSADFDPGPNVVNLTAVITGMRGIYVSKLDASGDFVWAKALNLTAYDPSYGSAAMGQSIVTDDSGNVYVSGYFSGTVDFDPGPGAYPLAAKAWQDIFILKLNSKGDFVWAKAIGSIDRDRGTAIALDKEGNVLVTGVFYDTTDFDPGPGTSEVISNGDEDVFILKLKNNGDFVWAKSVGGPNSFSGDQGQAITADEAGNVYVAGEFRNTVDFDPGPGKYELTTSGGSSTFLLKLDAAGNFVFAKMFHGEIQVLAAAVALDADKNILVGGQFRFRANYPIDFDPGLGDADTFFMTSAGQYDGYIVKLDTAGRFMWARQFGGPGWESINTMSIDDYGNIVISGGASNAGDYDPGPCVYTLDSLVPAPTSFYTSCYLLKLDNNGKFIWARNWGGTGNHAPTVHALHKDYIYVSGDFNGAIDFDPGPDTVMLYPFERDIYVLKFSDKDTVLRDYAKLYGPEGICPGGTYTYTVAPRDNDSTYIWELPEGWSGSSDSNSITVTTGAEGGTISVRVVSCDTSEALILEVGLLISPVNITVDSFTLGTTPSDYDSYQWFLEGEAINGAIAPQYGVSENGEYSVVVTKNGCRDTAYYTVTNVSIAGIDAFGREVLLYPNPTTGHVLIRVSQPLTAGRVRIINVTGQTVMEAKDLKGSEFRYGLSAHPAGIYFVKLEEKGRSVRMKLVKE